MNVPPGQPQQAQYVPPQRSQQPQWRPVLVYGIIAFTAFIFLIQLLTQSPNGIDLPTAFGAKDNTAILQGQVWRLITPLFLHGSIFHILANMYSLYALGPLLERFYGRRRFLLLYFLAGISGNIASFYFTSSDSIGASTAIFGLAAAYLVFVYRNRPIFGGQSGRILRNLVLVIALNLALGFAVPGIDYFGHLGGIVGGLAFSWFAGPVLKKQTVPQDYSSGAGQAAPAIGTPRPLFREIWVDEVTSTQTWLTAGIELAFFVLLVVVRMMRLA